jgi:hypothetical protein
MSYARIFAVLAAMAVAGIASAQPASEEPAGQPEEYVIRPGVEPLVSEMLGSGQTLPGQCTFSDGRIERTAVVATYTCGAASVVVQLIHPSAAPSGGVRTQRFVIAVKSGAPPTGLVEALADRIRAREAEFEWTDLGGGGRRTRRVAVGVAAVAAVAIVLFWALRRRSTRID